jgi:hypothetical protein
MKARAACLAFLPLSILLAQSAQAKKQPLEGYRFGLQGGVVYGTSDTFKYFSDKKMGFTIGGQVTRDLRTPLQRLRARVDLTTLPKATVRTGSGPGRLEDNTITGLAAGLDYLHFLQDGPEGLYLAGGLAVFNWKQDSSLTGATTSLNPGIAAGAGWQFNRDWSVEVRATWSRWDTNQRPVTNHNAGTLSFQVGCRF